MSVCALYFLDNATRIIKVAAMTLNVAVRLTVSGADDALSITPPALTETPAAEAAIKNLQTIGTSAEALVVGDIGTGRWLAGKNTDATNYVELSLASDGSTPFAKIRPGQPFLIPIATKVIYAKANTAPVVLNYVMTSD